MAAIEADEELKGPVSDDRVYDLVLAATGSVQKAEDAHQHRVMSRMRRGETPQI